MNTMLKNITKAAACAALCLACAGPAAAQFYADNQQQPSQPPEKYVNFCAEGKLFIFTGNCTLAPNARYQESISEKGCGDVRSVLSSSLRSLYPHAKVLDLRNQTGNAVAGRLSTPDPDGMLGFFFIGEGNTEGGFITGPAKNKVYPSRELCVAKYDVFGGFTSYSKFSPAVPAPAKLRGQVMSKTELIYNPASAVTDSWPQACRPMVSLVYPTRTLAGRMKNDAIKLVAELEEKKNKQALKVLEKICKMCSYYVQNGDELAKLCPPNSDVCTVKRIPPAGMKLVLNNYCTAIPAGMPKE